MTFSLMRIAHIIGEPTASSERTVAARQFVTALSQALGRSGFESTVLSERDVAEYATRKPASEVVHIHVPDLPFPLHGKLSDPTVVTLHGRVDQARFAQAARAILRIPCVATSCRQPRQRPWLNWCAVVHNGLPEGVCSFNANPKKYLAYVGPLSPCGRLDRAVEVACRSQLELKIMPAGAVDREYAERVLGPLRDDPKTEVLLDSALSDRAAVVGNALALLVCGDDGRLADPTLLLAMAAGTPVLAFAHSSADEFIKQRTSGFVVDSVYDAVDVLDDIVVLDREQVRRYFEQYFSALRMAENYANIYRSLADPRQTTINAWPRRLGATRLRPGAGTMGRCTD